MSNPPAGWYPDPTGQPDTIRWWNGKQWTNRTEKEAAGFTEAEPGAESVDGAAASDDGEPVWGTTSPQEPVSAEPEPAQPQQGWGATASVQEGPSASTPTWGATQTGWDTTSPPQQEQGGWWTNPIEAVGASGPRLAAVGPVDGGDAAVAGGAVRGDDGLTPFERARATWNAPEIAPAPPEHWTQQPVPDVVEAAPEGEAPAPEAEQAAPNGWTLRLADTPEADAQADAEADALADAEADAQAEAGTAGAGAAGRWGASGGDWGVEGDTDVQAAVSTAGGWGTEAEADVQAGGWGLEAETGEQAAAPGWGAADGGAQAGTANTWGTVAGDGGEVAAGAGDVAAGGEQGWSDVSWTQDPNAARKPRESGAVAETSEVQASASAEPDSETTQVQPTWGGQTGEAEQVQPTWGGQTGDEATQVQPTWGGQAGSGAAPVQSSWGVGPDLEQGAGQQSWGVAASEEKTQLWGTTDTSATAKAPETADDAPESQASSWGAQQSAGAAQAGPSAWGAGQSDGGPWGGHQETGWGAGPQQTAGAPEQQQAAWGAGQGGAAPTQAEGGPWGGGQQAGGWGAGPGTGGPGRSGAKPSKPAKKSGGSAQRKSSGGGGGPSGAKLPLIIGGGIALVMLVVAAVFLIVNPGDKKADPTPPPPTNQPTNQPTGGTKRGESKNPKLHEGERIAATAISFPRRTGLWSDRKRLVPQLLDSSGQYIVLQQKFDGTNNWYANIFVGALGNQAGYGGDPKATALALANEVPASLYGGIAITRKPGMNGAVKRSDKSGWYVQQTVTAKSSKVTARVLTLTVAVFDLGDGTAVAYISDIPTNRPDLKAAESQAYKGINVG